MRLDQLLYDRKLMNQFGGYLQGQYWFTNQWFVNVAWGLIRDYGIDAAPPASWPASGRQPGWLQVRQQQRPGEAVAASIDLTLWYRPIEALKFGLQYSYERTDFLQKLNNPAVAALPGRLRANLAPGPRTSANPIASSSSPSCSSNLKRLT